jgi:hypothetical protein
LTGKFTGRSAATAARDDSTISQPQHARPPYLRGEPFF